MDFLGKHPMHGFQTGLVDYVKGQIPEFFEATVNKLTDEHAEGIVEGLFNKYPFLLSKGWGMFFSSAPNLTFLLKSVTPTGVTGSAIEDAAQRFAQEFSKQYKQRSGQTPLQAASDLLSGEGDDEKSAKQKKEELLNMEFLVRAQVSIAASKVQPVTKRTEFLAFFSGLANDRERNLKFIRLMFDALPKSAPKAQDSGQDKKGNKNQQPKQPTTPKKDPLVEFLEGITVAELNAQIDALPAVPEPTVVAKSWKTYPAMRYGVKQARENDEELDRNIIGFLAYLKSLNRADYEKNKKLFWNAVVTGTPTLSSFNERMWLMVGDDEPEPDRIIELYGLHPVKHDSFGPALEPVKKFLGNLVQIGSTELDPNDPRYKASVRYLNKSRRRLDAAWEEFENSKPN